MNKAWKIFGTVALLSLLIGIAGIGVGFFTGSSPVIIQNHGCLAPYMERLTINRDIIADGLRALLGNAGL